MRLAPLFLLVFVGLSGCSGCRKTDKAKRDDDDDRPRKHHVVEETSTPRAVWMRKSATGTEWTVMALRADDPGDPTPLDVGVEGSGIDARGFDRGRSMMLHAKVGAAHPIYRVTWNESGKAHAEKVVDEELGSMILLSDDGSVAVMESGGDPFAPGHVTTLTALRLDGSQTRMALHSFRYYNGGDVAHDGKTILLSGIPTSCTAKSFGACPIELWRAKIDGGSAKVEPIAADARAHYQPRFVYANGIFGRDSIVYQTTQNDTSAACASSLNDCKHDIVRLVDGATKPEVVRANAFGPAPSYDGSKLAFLTFDGTTCTRFPCLGATLVVANADGSGGKTISTADAFRFSDRSFSAEGKWIELGTGTTPHATKLCPVDGGKCRVVVNDDYFQTWLR